ncbi:MAG: phosphoglycolate phosphatase [Motiliproteus sp.]|nr:phosphoglycolate phosphatase [Motiliproteus sp.]MCW9053084.1 phosphoglycolate phosphatase [Motiliproteus sp.]
MSAASPFVNGSAPAAVVFDLDGTLIDSVPSLAVAVDRMLVKLQRPEAGIDKVRQWVGNGAAVLVQRALSGSVKVAEDLDEALAEQALAVFLEAYADCASEGTVLYPGVKDFLDNMQSRQMPMAVVTNKPLRFVPEILTTLSIDHYFQLLVGGECLTHKKPHPEPLLHAARKLGVKPQQLLMIGDSKHDVNAARNALCSVVGVTYGYNHGQPIVDCGPDWVVDSLMELL